MSQEYKQFFKIAQDVKAQRPAAPRRKPALEKNVKLKVRPAAPTPWRSMVALSLSLGALGFFLAAPDVCERWMDRIEVSAFGAAEAKTEVPAEKAKIRKPSSENSSTSKPTSATAKSPDETRLTSEDISHFDKLKERKEELDLREKELGQLEEELQRQKVELDKRIQQLEDMRSQIAQTLKDRVELDQEKVAKLVDLYSNMKPKQAAEVLGTINEELAVEVLAKMKKNSAAEIMNLLPADKAKILSEKYTGYRRSLAGDGKG